MNDVQLAYNSYWQLLADYQSHSGAVNVSTTPKVQYAYADGSANTIRPTSLTYPNGRVLHYDYGPASGIDDAVSRIASLIDNDGTTHLADYSYLGAGTIIQVNEPEPAIQYTLIGIEGGNDPDTGDIYRGLDRFSRVKDLVWAPTGGSSSSSSSSSSNPAGTDLVRIQHGYDRAGNRLWRKDPVAASYGAAFDELYGYDRLYRLTSATRGTLNSTQTGILSGSDTFAQCWTLDSTGNWSGFREDDTGDGTWDLIQARSANPVNEITGISNTTGPAWVQPAYDKAGNMTTIPQPPDPTKAYTGAYDAWNRLVKLIDAGSGGIVQTNAYDGRTYRTIRGSYTSGVLSETRHYFYTASWQAIEECVGISTNAERQFIWGLRFIDDLILRDRDTTGSGTLNERLYAVQDSLGSVVAVVDSTGVVQERYWSAAYAEPFVRTAVFIARLGSQVSWERYLSGYYLDTVTKLFVVRHRVLHYALGTWLTRDPLRDRLRGAMPYLNASANPTTKADPLGLCAVDPCKAIRNDQMCKRLSVFALSKKQLARANASVYCDTATGDATIVFFPQPKLDGLAFVGECIRQHEQVHIKQLLGQCPLFCRCKDNQSTAADPLVLGSGGLIGTHHGRRESPECAAYEVEAGCIHAALAFFGFYMSLAELEALQDALDHADDWLAWRCGIDPPILPSPTKQGNNWVPTYVPQEPNPFPEW